MNKVALITGGSRGIGLGIARHLATAGFDLAINGRRPVQQVSEVLDQLGSIGVDVIYCPGDISSAQDRANIVDKVKDHFGHLNALVNNAGMSPRQRMDILEATEESYDEVMQVNLKGPYFLTQNIANWMIAQKQTEQSFEGVIINVTSISAQLASVNRGEYCVSKAGLSMMTKLFAVRLADHDIPVYEIQPGIIKSDMTAKVEEMYNKRIANGLTLQKRWGRPDDVGQAVTALVNGQFAYATGQVFILDGGLTVPRL